MTAKSILEEIKPLGRDSYKRVLLNHGVKEPFFGVKIDELKKIQKRIKQDYRLALDLFNTGNYDAMYLAGLIADDAQMTKRDLQQWAEKAYGPLTTSTVPWVTAGSRHARELALSWIDSKADLIAAVGWATLSSLVAVTEDNDLDLVELKELLQRVQQRIHATSNEARSAMNGFVIAVGSYVKPLTVSALQIGADIGRVMVDVGPTACQVPYAPDAIRRVEKRGTLGKKRKSAKC